MVIVVVACVLLAIASFASVSILRSKTVEHCEKIMTFINKDYLAKNIGCLNKYTQIEVEINDLTCPKPDIKNHWEDDIFKADADQVDDYGCLNRECCDVLASWITSKVQYMALFGLVSFILGGIAAKGSNYMYKMIKPRTSTVAKYYNHEGYNDKIVLGLMILITLLAIIFTFFVMPKSPKKPPFFDGVEALENPFEIDALLKDNTGWFSVHKATIIEDNSQCGASCRVLDYTIKVSTDKGELKAPDGSTVTGTAVGSGWALDFTCAVDVCNTVLAGIKFMPTCLLEEIDYNLTYNIKSVTASNGGGAFLP
jgi:hypothetical protein